MDDRKIDRVSDDGSSNWKKINSASMEVADARPYTQLGKDGLAKCIWRKPLNERRSWYEENTRIWKERWIDEEY